MARRLVPLLVIASFALLVFAFAGCGGDDDSSAQETTATETTTTEETTEEEATEEESTDEESTDEESTEEESTETTSSGDTADNCEEFATIGSQISEAVSGTADLDEMEAAFAELTAAAPDEIKGDFETLSEYLGAVADAVGDVQPGQTPDPGALAKLAQLDATAATTASTNISTWVTENCTGTTP
jgi:hypothetical protein